MGLAMVMGWGCDDGLLWLVVIFFFSSTMGCDCRSGGCGGSGWWYGL